MASGPAPSRWVRVDDDVSGLTRVLLDRPPANAFTLQLYEALADVVTEIGRRRAQPPCVQLGSSVPGFFSAGRDTKEPRAVEPEEVARRHRVVTRLYEQLHGLTCPVVAVVDGYALGAGLVIASLCDLRIASEDSRFGLPEVAAGTVGGARHLLRVLPQGTVRHLALTGQHISAERARELGFLERVVPRSRLWEEADGLAASISSFEPGATARVKSVLNATEELPLRQGFAQELLSGVDRPPPDA